MRTLVLSLAVLSLQAQGGKPPVPAIAWSYETPRGFRLLEPGYRFPTQIKQALVQFVQPVPGLVREYQSVFQDKRKFSTWFRKVLTDNRTRETRAAKSDGTVISSDPSKTTRDGGVFLSTARTPPRKPDHLLAIESYLDVLKAWDPD
jgi:hypothetical protein